MVITFTTPTDWLRRMLPDYQALTRTNALLKDAVKSLLIEALKLGIEPAPPDGDENDVPDKFRSTISLPEPYSSLMRSLSVKHALSAGPLALALLHSLSQQTDLLAQGDATNSPIASLTTALAAKSPSTVLRQEQVRMYANLQDALESGRIAMCEASTGVGKTRVMMCAAGQWVADNGTRCVITAPTLALLRQFAAEHARQAEVVDMPSLRVVFGRREFVSAHAIKTFLGNEAESRKWSSDALTSWLETGESSTGHRGITQRWLCSSLESISPGFPLDEVRVDEITAEDDPGMHAYRRQFERDDLNEIVLCSHAMLAQHMRRRMIAASRDPDYQVVTDELKAVFARVMQDKAQKFAISSENKEALGELRALEQYIFANSEAEGLLPHFECILVDEAHVLEEQFSNSLTEYLALRSIVRLAEEYKEEGGPISKLMIAEIAAIVDSIAASGKSLDNDISSLGRGHPALSSIRYGLESLSTALSMVKISKSANPARQIAGVRLKRAMAVMGIACGTGRNRSYIRFSPVRAYPQLFVGRSTVENVLSLLWASVRAGAAVSATLYLGTTTQSAFYQRTLLAIPPERAAEYPPIVAPWLTDSVKTLWVPDKALGEILRPPSRADKITEAEQIASEKRWIANLAPYLSAIHNRSPGGVLVLMTSFSTVEQVVELLHAEDPSRTLIVATGNTPVTKQRTDYLQAVHAGKRPLWLSVGAAWTGLDVGGHDPWAELFGEQVDAAEDQVLTTLVIPRLPFGTNQSITHAWRKGQKAGVPWEMFETAFRFKQGLGRLIRRMGLPANREIYVLDGRLREPKFSAGMSMFEKIMANYSVVQAGVLEEQRSLSKRA